MIVFDLDGCLIDSEELIREAYREAGAEAPDNFLSLGHHDWIEQDRAAVHARKNEAYLRRLITGFRPLPAWRTAEMLRIDGYEVGLLTGAPAGTIAVLAAVAETWPFSVGCCVPAPAEKTMWLAARLDGGVYVDDQFHVKLPPGWRFVHYTGQDADELYMQVTG